MEIINKHHYCLNTCNRDLHIDWWLPNLNITRHC